MQHDVGERTAVDARSHVGAERLSTAIGQLTYAFGPGLMGLIRDLSGDYAMALWVCALLDLAAAATVLVRVPRRQL